MEKQIVISVYRGHIELESTPDDVKVILHDYDVNDIERDNPNRKYGNGELGDYEVIRL